MVHLGLGSFFLAHQAAYTHLARDSDQWGFAAFGGRGDGRSGPLAAQEGLYTLVLRGGDGDVVHPIGSLVAAHGAADVEAWHLRFADPTTAVVTTTVTEAGYLIGPDGRPELDHPALRRDLDVLRSDPRSTTTTAVGRLVAGLDTRRRADAGPITLVPCDNLSDNGDALRNVVVDVADAVDPTLASWIDRSVSVVSTVVDRITPRTTDADVAAFTRSSGKHDPCLVVTEPFAEWILGTDGGGDRSTGWASAAPDWASSGARIVADVEPFERRKLWLLNGAHSLLAYAGSLVGHTTVADAFADPEVRGWVEDWWDEASAHLVMPKAEVAAYRGALADRFANPRIEHLLAQIAADGSAKLRVRVVPILRAQRSAGRPAPASARIVAAWLCHLRGGGTVSDPRAQELVSSAAGPLAGASRRIVAALDPDSADDDGFVASVSDLAEEIEGSVSR